MMDCCKQKQQSVGCCSDPMPGAKEQPGEDRIKPLIGLFLLIVLLGGFVLAILL